MNIDIRLSINFYDHHKTIRLKKKLGFEAIEALHRLWFFAAESRPDGVLRNMDAEDIATVSRWQGDAEEFINTLSDEKYPWLDKVNGCYCLHNWEKRNGYVAHSEARSNKARKAAQVRWEKHNNLKNQQDNAKCINEQCNENAQSNAPSPAPSPIPDPSPKPKENTLAQNNAFARKFALFWKVYPKKKNKGNAEKAFKKAHVDEQLLSAILTGIERAKKSHEWLKENGQFIPYPASWLNAKGWEDEIITVDEEKQNHDEAFKQQLEESKRRMAEKGL